MKPDNINVLLQKLSFLVLCQYNGTMIEATMGCIPGQECLARLEFGSGNEAISPISVIVWREVACCLERATHYL